MKSKYKPATTKIEANESYEGETIEEKIRRIMNNKEPITDGAPLIYTERKNGVEAQYNIRTDRWEVALDAMDKVSRTEIARREKRISDKEAKIIEMNEKNGETPANTSDQSKSSETH